MGPRKKAKLSKNADATSSREPSAATVPLPASPESSNKHIKLGTRVEEAPTPSSSQDRSLPTHAENNAAQPTTNHLRESDRTSSSQSTKSWYGVTWPRIPKAAPVTQLAKDSISAVGEVASEVATSARQRTQQELTIPLKTPSLYLSRSLGSSSRSLPLSATTTKVNISSSPLNKSERSKNDKVRDDETTQTSISGSEVKKDEDDRNDKVNDEQRILEPKEKVPNNSIEGSEVKPQEEIADRTSSWLSWFSKGESTSSQAPSNLSVAAEPSNISDANSTVPEEVAAKSAPSDRLLSESDQRRNSDPHPLPVINLEAQQRRSWLGYWSRDEAKPKEIVTEPFQPANYVQGETSDIKKDNLEDPSQNTAAKTVNESLAPSQSSGWAFWSRNSQNNLDEDSAKADVGELAVAKSPSQSKPESAVIDGDRGLPKATDKLGKSERPPSSDLQKGKKPSNVVSASTKSSSATAGSISSSTQPPKTATTQLKDNTKNLLLPLLKQTYKATESLSLLQQLGQLLSYTKAPEPKHLNLIRDPPRIKTALTIGVHGYFPAPFIRTVLGQPTGTSIKFAESAASAIRKWTLDHGYSCEVEKVALEGEGKIEERIELLWKLLLNWLDKIRKADFILVACHSQGVPVAMMLVAKLIAFGCVNSARIGVCAMAGVSLGPFADYKSRWISGSAGELFEFARPDSKVSKDYEAALLEALEFGVKVLYIGSIDDQLVSLEVK